MSAIFKYDKEKPSAYTPGERPIQLISWADKTKNDFDWFKANARYYISRANFESQSETNTTGKKNLKQLYEVYNNQFPKSWFSHVTDPLSAKKKEHRSFPAKIRPVGILRTNIDLLLGEFPRRPFVYNVENLGDTGYNSFVEGLANTMHGNLTQHFIAAALEELQASGEELTEEQVTQIQQKPPLPEQVAEQFQATFKDLIAIKGQKFLKRVIRDYEIKKKLHKLFKDNLIAGEYYSYKGVRNGTLVYRRVSPLDICYDQSADSDAFVEDGEWVVCRRFLSMSDIVDEFYRNLDKSDLQKLEQLSNGSGASPTAFYSALRGIYTDGSTQGKIPVFHVQWKGKEKVYILHYFDEMGQPQEMTVDEDYVAGEEEVLEELWINKVYETEQIGGLEMDLFVNMQPVVVQRNEMNNISKCKLNYNGRKFSNTHSDNISVLEMGIPFQIFYIIVNYIIEKTIAKSKGKITMIDINAIPKHGDWTEEKFFYYSEALGYMLVDRNQTGVDKSWNQYQVLDMSLFESIEQLINIKNSIKEEWDDVLGISRQRKGQTYSSDGQGVNERAVFQSTVITDMIFIGFEEFIERELQGIMDYAPALTAQGIRSMYIDDDLGAQLMEILPEDFQFEQLGVFVDNSSEHMEKLREMRNYAQAMLQNNAKGSTVLEVIDAVNISELKTKLKRIEAIEQEIAQQQAQSEQDAVAQQQEVAERHAEYLALLERQTMHEEYDRKMELDEMKETLKGDYMLEAKTIGEGDKVPEGPVVDPTAVAKLNLDRQKQNDKVAETNAKLQLEQAKIQVDSAHKNEDRKIERMKLAEQVREAALNYNLAKQKMAQDAVLKRQQIKAQAKKAAAAKKSKPKQ